MQTRHDTPLHSMRILEAHDLEPSIAPASVSLGDPPRNHEAGKGLGFSRNDQNQTVPPPPHGFRSLLSSGNDNRSSGTSAEALEHDQVCR
jgi:hypothetical protein